MTHPAKIKLKVGTIEIEYEGDPSFLNEGLEALLVTMSGLAAATPPDDDTDDSPSDPPLNNGSQNGLALSTNTIAARFGSKSGSDLAICAIAQIELIQGRSGASRAQILEEMKGATTYYRTSMRNNLSSTISTLVKSKKVNQLASDKYALTASERKLMEEKIVED